VNGLIGGGAEEMPKRRVVITGLGMVSPLGVGNDANWEALRSAKSGIGLITHFDTSEYPVKIAGEVRGFDPLQFIDKKELKKMDRFIHFALAASQFAVEDSGIDPGALDSDRAGVSIGSGIGGLGFIERQHKVVLERGPHRISPFFIPGLIVNLAAGHVSIRFRARGPNMAQCTACSTGTHAVGEAFRVIQHGQADLMIAGGTEAVICPLAVGGFSAMKALSTRNDDPATASRPFDATRDGFVMGEGAGVLILEERDAALARGARIYAELAGFGMTADAFHITAPSEDGDGAMRVMKATLDDAGVAPEAVDYINAHGTATPPGDRTETLAIRKLFGDHAYKLAVSSTKSSTGHLLGAAGGVETAITAWAVCNDILPPTINLQHPDPDCDLDYVPNVARPSVVSCALNNSFGFGGTNACLLLKKHE
jgi:3-oxoacyl-[acyl-carrier-protein] synthase II